MRIVIRCVFASLAATLLGACASTPKSTMLVPSRTTVTELEKLSHQAGTSVDVLTVNRKEWDFQLDAGDGSALIGHDHGEVVRIPLDNLALVYYSAAEMPKWDVYPSLPEVGPAERGLSCDELDVELSRTETVRWYARTQGALPFVAHERAALNAEKALKGVGEAAWVVLEMYGGYGGSGGRGQGGPNLDAYRLAVTGADRRIIGLLDLKRKGSCAAQQARQGGETDLALLSQIEESRQALAVKQITDQEYSSRKTALLDLFDPLLPEAVAAGVAGPMQGYERVTWYSSVDATANLKALITQLGLRGGIKLTDEELEFQPEPGADAPLGDAVHLRYAEVANVVVADHGQWRGVVVTGRDGRKDTFCIAKGLGIDLERTRVVGELLKSMVVSVTH